MATTHCLGSKPLTLKTKKFLMDSISFSDPTFSAFKALAKRTIELSISLELAGIRLDLATLFIKETPSFQL